MTSRCRMSPSGRRWRDRRMWLDHDNGSGRHRSCQLIQQRLCLLQDRRVETFTEPVIDRREQVTGFRMSVLVPREPRELRAIGKNVRKVSAEVVWLTRSTTLP